MSKHITRKLFGAKSSNDITLDDINTQLGNILVQRKLGNINKAEYAKYKAHLLELQDTKIEALKAASDKEKRIAAYIAKQKERKAHKAMDENRKIGSINAEYKSGTTYIVSANVRIKYERPVKGGTTVILQSDVMVSEEVVAQNRDTKYDLLERAMEKYKNTTFTAYSEFNIAYRTDVNVVPKVTVNLRKVKMKGVKMLYKSFKDIPHIHEGQCVIDYLLWEASKKDSRKSWTRPMLQERLGDEPDTMMLEFFCRTEKNVALYALDPMLKVFSVVEPVETARVWLYFVVNNNHLYPITDDTLRHKITSKKEVNFQDIQMGFKDFEEVDALDESLVFTSEKNHVIVKGVDDLTAMAGKVMADTQHLVERFSFYDHKLTAFQHPEKEQIFVAGRDWDERKAICDEYYAKHRVADFKFINQSWGKISRTMFDHLYGSIPPSQYGLEYQEILKAYPMTPYRMCYEKDNKAYKSIDIRRCYSSILLGNSEPYPIFSPFDSVEPVTITSAADIKPGEYYIQTYWNHPIRGEQESETFTLSTDIVLSRGFYPSSFVKYVLENNYIKPSNIKYGIVARGFLPADTFKPFVEQVIAEFPDRSKDLINMLVGCFGSLYARNEKAGVTNDLITALATMSLHRDKKAVLNKIGDLHVIRIIEERMKEYGDMPIFRSVIAQGIVALDKLTKDVVIPGKTQVLGYNTDAIKIRGEFNSDSVSDDCGIGGYHSECVYFGDTLKPRSGLHPNELDVRDAYVFVPCERRESVDTPIGHESALVLGEAGSGKSYQIAKMYEPSDIVLCFTNLACENLKKVGVEARTFDSYLYDPKKGAMDAAALAGAKRVVVDEYTMLPPKYMSILMSAQAKYGFNVLLFGDPAQCKAPTDDWVKYDTNAAVLRMVKGNVVRLSYKFKRYDAKLYAVLTQFKKTGKLKMKSKNTVLSYNNICKTNAVRRRINRECFTRWVAEKAVTVVRVKDFEVALGLEVMAYDVNDVERGIYKTTRYVIKSIDADTVALERNGETVALPYDDFVEIFDYSFCYTMYKIQGAEIRTDYNIYEANMMSRNELYTAVSRGVSIDKVHLDTLRDGVYYWDREKTLQHKVKKSDLKTGRIYRIEFSDGSHYIGKTEKTLEKRLEEHKAKPTSAKMAAAFAANTFTISLLDEFLFSQPATILKIEAQWIHNLASSSMLNSKHNVPTTVAVPQTNKFKKGKFHITEKVERKMFRIRYTIDKKEHDETFSYTKCSRDEAVAAAEKRQQILKSTY